MNNNVVLRVSEEINAHQHVSPAQNVSHPPLGLASFEWHRTSYQIDWYNHNKHPIDSICEHQVLQTNSLEKKTKQNKRTSKQKTMKEGKGHGLVI